jgi:hypothetical protein
MTTQFEIGDDFNVFSDDLHISEEKVDPDILKARKVDLKNATQRIIKGMASTSHVDTDNESVIQQGLDISYFKSQGWFNWMHNNSPSHIIGCPTESRVDSNGLFVKGMLFKTEMANHVWNLICELHDVGNPRNMGFSIEGKVTKRSEMNKSKILEARITNVAITHIPVNIKATLTIDNLTKSMVPSSYDDILKYVLKDMNKDVMSGCEAVGLQAGVSTSGIAVEGTSGGAATRKQDMEGDKKKKNKGVPETKQLIDPTKESEFRKKSILLFETRKEIHDLIKSVNPEASDVVVDEVINLITKAGGLDNFFCIIEKSDIF